MARLKTFKLLVMPNENGINVCTFINQNILDINRLGVKIQIEKISNDDFDEEMVEILRRKNILRLPALIGPDGKVFIGHKAITDLFNKNLNRAQVTARVENTSSIGSNPDMSDFWMKEMYQGRQQDGRLIPRVDKDDSDDETADMQKKMSEYNRNVPKHRKQTVDDYDHTPTRSNHPQDNIADDDDDNYDIYAQDKPMPVKLGPTDDRLGDDMDQRMLSAWMNNNQSDMN